MSRLRCRLPATCLTLACVLLGPAAHAQAQADSEEARFVLHGQTTFVWQAKPAFHAAYSGSNSLSPLEERAYSLTATADLGLRLWQGAQLHLNPEATKGEPMSRLAGAGGLSNGELARTSGPEVNTYRARLFLLQRWDAGDERETLEAGFNELGGTASTRRWTLVAGNFSLLDYFDANPYAKDPRSQFLNWAFMTYGAWDYAADSRGYSNAVLLEYSTPAWAVRAARAAVPVESNGLALDGSLGQRYGDQLEIEADLPLRLSAGPLHASALWFRNQAVMGSYAEALARGGTPDVGQVRRLQNKTGWGFTLQAPLTEEAGLFLRLSANDGGTETYAFTEIDRQRTVGAQFTGAAWGRRADRWGVALAINELSATHRDYLAAGGLGFFLGDGALNYAAEEIVETWYRWALPDWGTRAGKVQSAVSLGWQHIRHPGYNQDRGPAQVYSLRWHSEF
jgi:hypothetical protein